LASTTSTDYAKDAEEQLREFVAAALDEPDKAELVAVKGTATSQLLKASADATVLVLGEAQPHRSGIARTGVAPSLVLKATCPIVVMPRR